MTATVFQRVGPYEIVEEIGRGGMAAVFLAEDSRHDRKVALKLVPLGNDREHREILEAERMQPGFRSIYAGSSMSLTSSKRRSMAASFVRWSTAI
jgi:serine/threonine protein kinase